MDYELQWARAFAITLAIELPMYTWLLRRAGWSAPRALAGGFAANALSHPLLWFALPRFEPYWLFAATGEAMVVAVEWGVLAVLARKRDARLAVIVLVVNAASMLVGFTFLSG